MLARTLNSESVGLFRIIEDGEYMKKSLFAALFVALSVCTQGQEKRPPTPLEDLNIEFMMRG